MIISGTTLGAGMFSIPVVTAGVWFTGSIVLLLYTWVCMYISGLMILEVNINYPIGASFHTMVDDLLGKKWNLLNNISITFVLYILTYAYIISAGQSMITHTLESYLNIKQATVSLTCAVIVAYIIWRLTHIVDLLNTILISGMIITFLLSTVDMFINVNTLILFNTNDTQAQYLPYTLVALPYLLTSFGYHSNIPGLVRYYNKNAQLVALSLLIGTLIALIIYIFWQYVIQGNISRTTFQQIIAEGGNIGSLLKQVNKVSHNIIITKLLKAFSYMALTSSFLGVSLGLFDFISDYFKLNNTDNGRKKAILITFLPPTLGAIIFPNSFLYAIGFAGLAATIWTVIVPAMMVRASRKRFSTTIYKVPGGSIMILFIIFFGLINIITYILSLFNVLPIYK
ncbi:aromatic amino acid transporter [Candidatus Profftia lariciata]|uniref:aromatic amino acid transporter n=1 Tax=Candidatus Profftia lariciata TaxID=1987921 RepID=UPI001EF0DD37|nr:aromatic amino acid transporter [Candidatus Profftia lariciata]